MTNGTYNYRMKNGDLLISRTDGEDLTFEEAQMFRDYTETALRVKNQREYQGIESKYGLRPDDFQPRTAISKSGKEVEIDELVVQVFEEQIKRGTANTHIAPLMGVHPTMLSNYRMGRTRPPLDTLRTWAYLMGFDILLVPMQLREQVRILIKNWRDERRRSIEDSN